MTISRDDIDRDRLVSAVVAAVTAQRAAAGEKRESRIGVTFDRAFKTVAALAAVFTALWGIWQYVDTAQRDAAKPFKDERIKDCAAASSAAASIAAPVDGAQQAQQQNEFWRLYWGPLAIVENSDVAEKMVDFGELLIKSAARLKSGSSLDGDALTNLRQGALAISHACRDMISADFTLQLPPGLNKLTNLLEHNASDQ